MKTLSLKGDMIEKTRGNKGRLRILRCLNKNPHGLTRYRFQREKELSHNMYLNKLRNFSPILLEIIGVVDGKG